MATEADSSSSSSSSESIRPSIRFDMADTPKVLCKVCRCYGNIFTTGADNLIQHHVNIPHRTRQLRMNRLKIDIQSIQLSWKPETVS